MFSKLINVIPTPALGYPLCCQKVTSVFCAYILHQENPTAVELQTLRDVTSQIFLHPAFKDLQRQRLQTQAIYPCGVFFHPLKKVFLLSNPKPPLLQFKPITSCLIPSGYGEEFITSLIAAVFNIFEDCYHDCLTVVFFLD